MVRLINRFISSHKKVTWDLTIHLICSVNSFLGRRHKDYEDELSQTFKTLIDNKSNGLFSKALKKKAVGTQIEAGREFSVLDKQCSQL